MRPSPPRRHPLPTDLERHARLLRYDAWANAETLASLGAVAPAAAVRWMAHIPAAELLWLGRLREQPSELPVWPDLDLEEIGRALDGARLGWADYLAGLDETDLAEGLGYRNSQGEFWVSTVDDILTHVVVHSAYHRGQIAAAVRDAGGRPSYTDFIHAARQGLVE